MRWQFQILLYFVCLNLSTGLVAEINASKKTLVASATEQSEYYSEHFNATEVAKEWKGTHYIGIQIIDLISSAFQILSRAIPNLIAGFPMFLMWLGDTYIIDASARTTYNVFVGTLIAIFYVLMFFFAIEFISGREVVG